MIVSGSLRTVADYLPYANGWLGQAHAADLLVLVGLHQRAASVPDSVGQLTSPLRVIEWRPSLQRRAKGTICDRSRRRPAGQRDAAGVRPRQAGHMSMLVVLSAPFGPGSAIVSPGAIIRSIGRAARTGT